MASTMRRPELDTAERLRLKLDTAAAAASDAYRDTARLIRLLTVIGQPSPPEELIDRTLTVLSEVFIADVTCIVQVGGTQTVVTSSCGLPEGDAAYSKGWPLAGAAVEALTDQRPVTVDHPGGDDIPAALRSFGVRSAVWVPMFSGADGGGELLALFRSSGEPFIQTDLQVLGPVASRLRLSIEARARSVAIERLARFGHRLARHLDHQSLLNEAVGLLPKLITADCAWVAVIEDGMAELRAISGAVPETVARNPRPATELAAWDAAVLGKPYHSYDLVPRRRDAEERACSATPRAVLCIPVMRDGGPAALICAARDTPRPFTRDALEISTIFANYLGVAMANAELYLALEGSEASLRLITDSISDMVAVVDAGGRFVYASPSHGREFAYDPEQLLGRTLAELAHQDDRPRLEAALAGVANSPKVEYRLRTGRGDWAWVESALRPAPQSDGTVVVSSRVIDQRKQLEADLRQRATHDPLTGLANRDLVVQRLDEALRRDTSTHVGLLFCDLDKFKAVNDRLGHEAGDELLQQVAYRLRRCLRPNDLLARFGGDEFVFLLDGVSELSHVNAVGRRVLLAFQEPCTLRGEQVRVSASVGGVLGVRGKTTASTMLRDVDAAMYAAKAKGLGLVEVFDDVASHRSLDRLDVRYELLRALDRDQLSVHYQPIFTLDTGSIVAFEALLRWTHPERGPIPPGVFVPLAEETEAIIPIGQWVLEQACQQLVEWQRSPRGRHLDICVNLSATQLQQPELAARTLAATRGAGVDPADVWLELTEHGSISNDATHDVSTLRAAGIHFALDDFGISHSNLSYLRNFPIECLKIDRSFVAELTAKETDRSIVRAILAIADSLDLEVVAEGVETVGQRDSLLALGCRRGQGYLRSRPLPPKEATALLNAPHGLSLNGRATGPANASRPGRS